MKYLVIGILTILLNYTLCNVSKAEEIIKGYNFYGNGWQSKLDCFNGDLKQDNLTSVKLDTSTGTELKQAITNQLNILKNGKKTETSLTLNTAQLIAILEKVNKKINTGNPATLLTEQRYHRLSGEDGCGNVLLTGYYTPNLKLKRKADAVYRYPLYKKPTQWPNNQPLTRAQIDISNALYGMGLEIGYSASLLENYIAHIQGSTYVHFVDTNEYATLAFSGKNGEKYKSLGKYLVAQGHVNKKNIGLASIRQFFDKNPSKLSKILAINSSYVFFTEVNTPPITSSGVPAITKVTAAVDPNYIPYGSVLLVEYPILNNKGEVVKRQNRLVIASDSGSAIKGSGHIDLYMGRSDKAAGQLHHYGQVWLITE